MATVNVRLGKEAHNVRYPSIHVLLFVGGMRSVVTWLHCCLRLRLHVDWGTTDLHVLPCHVPGINPFPPK